MLSMFLGVAPSYVPLPPACARIHRIHDDPESLLPARNTASDETKDAIRACFKPGVTKTVLMIKKETGLGESTIRRALLALEDGGEMERRLEKTRMGSTGYWLLAKGGQK